MYRMLNEPCDRLREARARAGLRNYSAAAKKYGWNENTYKSHENGTRGITKTAAMRYAKAFHVSAGWILTNETSALPFLATEERNVLAKFRLLTIEQRDLVLALCDSLIGALPHNPPESNTPTKRRRA
jgi:DNA-binding XRE family transcriptional regulator